MIQGVIPSESVPNWVANTTKEQGFGKNERGARGPVGLRPRQTYRPRGPHKSGPGLGRVLTWCKFKSSLRKRFARTSNTHTRVDYKGYFICVCVCVCIVEIQLNRGSNVRGVVIEWVFDLFVFCGYDWMCLYSGEVEGFVRCISFDGWRWVGNNAVIRWMYFEVRWIGKGQFLPNYNI